MSFFGVPFWSDLRAALHRHKRTDEDVSWYLLLLCSMNEEQHREGTFPVSAPE